MLGLQLPSCAKGHAIQRSPVARTRVHVAVSPTQAAVEVPREQDLSSHALEDNVECANHLSVLLHFVLVMALPESADCALDLALH